MQAIEIAQPGGPEVLRLVERPRPAPARGELLIRVVAAGVNRPDVLQRRGAYAPPPGASDLPGLEVAGVVEDGDLDGSGLAKGDAVTALVAGGGYAEYCVAPVGQTLPLPRGLSFADKCRACEALGAQRGIDYRTEDFVAVVKQATGGRGVDVVLDMVAGDYVAREIDCLADDGRLLIIATLGGSKAQVDVGQVLRRRLTVTGSTLRPRSVEFKAAIARRLQAVVWPLIEAGRIKPMVYRRFALGDAAAAHGLMESSTHIGKIVLDVAPA